MSPRYTCLWDDCEKDTGSPRTAFCPEHRSAANSPERRPPRTGRVPVAWRVENHGSPKERSRYKERGG